MAVNVKTKSVTSAVSSGDYLPSGFALGEIRDDSPPNFNDIDICTLLSDIDLNADQPLLKNVSSETICKHNDDSISSLSCLLNEEVLALLEDASDRKDANKCSTESKLFNMPSFGNSDVTLSCLAESHLKSERKDIVHLKLDDLDDGLLPDIDLNFCVKKSDADAKPSSLGSSPNTVDSGFDEENLDVAATLKVNTLSFGVEICTEKKFASALTNPKPSLLSKSLSYSVKSSILKSERVKNIRRELIKNHFRIKTFLCQDFSPHANIASMVEDRSNHCVFNASNINNIRCEPKNYFDLRPFSEIELPPQEKSTKMLEDSADPSTNGRSEPYSDLSENGSPANSFLIDDFPPLANSAKMIEITPNHSDFDIKEDRSKVFKNNFPSNSFLDDDFPPLEKVSELVEGGLNHGVLNVKRKKSIRSEPVKKSFHTKSFLSDDFPPLKKTTKTYKDKLNHSAYKIKNMKNKPFKNNFHNKTYHDDFPPLEKLTK